MLLGEIVFLKSQEPGTEDWVFVNPEDHPPNLTDPDTLGKMIHNFLIAEVDGWWYRPVLKDQLVMEIISEI